MHGYDFPTINELSIVSGQRTLQNAICIKMFRLTDSGWGNSCHASSMFTGSVYVSNEIYIISSANLNFTAQ